MQTLISFFIKYILAPLLVIILLFVMNNIKKTRKQINVKNIIIYVLLTGIALGIPSIFVFLKDEYIWGGLVLTNVSYLALGSIFLMTLDGTIGKTIGCSGHIPSQVLLLIISAILGGWIYFLVFDHFGDMPYSAWATMSVTWFTLPFLTICSYRAFYKIPPPLYRLWKSEPGAFNRSRWDNVDNFQALPVKVQLKKQTGDNEYATLIVRLQDNITLGEWFEWLVEDQNRRSPGHRIEMFSDSDSGGWIFYTTRWINYPLFIRVLDPEKDRVANQIKKNQRIYIKRVVKKK